MANKPNAGRRTVYISLESPLYRQVRKAAAEADKSTSSFIADMLRQAVPAAPDDGLTPGQRLARRAITSKHRLRNRAPLEVDPSKLMRQAEK
jgi:hypothetical protein